LHFWRSKYRLTGLVGYSIYYDCMQDKCKRAIAKEIYLAYSSPAHFRSLSLIFVSPAHFRLLSLIFVTATRLMRVDSSRRDRAISFNRNPWFYRVNNNNNNIILNRCVFLIKRNYFKNFTHFFRNKNDIKLFNYC